MAQIIVTKRLQNFRKFEKLAARLATPRALKSLHQGVINAGRKTKTQVQRAVRDQMAVAPGSYQKYVVANMRFRSNQAAMSATISASQKGGEITDFKGLKSLSSKGRAVRRYNPGKSFRGTIRSEVWNKARVFQRSFLGSSGKYLALIRGGGKSNSTMPKEFWTHDSRSWQARSADGRFAKMGAQKWRVRRLRGPALNKELDQGQSVAKFLSFGPAELERQIEKRLETIMKW